MRWVSSGSCRIATTGFASCCVERALGLLRAWDGSIRADSAAAALYEVWAYRHLARAAMGQLEIPIPRSPSGESDRSSVANSFRPGSPMMYYESKESA
jgi:hypothetical protein